MNRKTANVKTSPVSDKQFAYAVNAVAAHEGDNACAIGRALTKAKARAFKLSAEQGQ